MSDRADHALAIANLKARYCRAADTAASDVDAARALFVDLFTEDFVGDFGLPPEIGGLLHGGQAITDFLCASISRGSVWMIHMLHSPLIEIDGMSATGQWTVLAQSRRRDSGVLSTAPGRYSDVFRLTEDGWRIARITQWRPE